MMILLTSIVVLFLYMTTLFLIGTYTKNNGIADVGYGIAFIVTSIATLLQVLPVSVLQTVLVLLPCLWGTRLAVRIFLKNNGKPEDFRYAAWRKEWKQWFTIRSFFQVYILQGIVIFLVSLPILIALVYPSSTPSLFLFSLGFLVWCVGFFFESVGDYQLDSFIRKSENKGKIMMSGLWKYSRHPNYFGESTMWVGIAIASSGLTTLPLVGFISPLLITFLLLKVSGVPLLEKHWEHSPEWNVYKSKTSVFIPLPPKK